MGWEQRGRNQYYYRKEREGARVKSTYIGRGDLAHTIANFEKHSFTLEKLMRAKKTMEAEELENAEAVLDRAVELVQLVMEATLLTAGFHTHRRQWRRKRNVPGC